MNTSNETSKFYPIRNLREHLKKRYTSCEYSYERIGDYAWKCISKCGPFTEAGYAGSRTAAKEAAAAKMLSCVVSYPTFAQTPFVDDLPSELVEITNRKCVIAGLKILEDHSHKVIKSWNPEVSNIYKVEFRNLLLTQNIDLKESEEDSPVGWTVIWELNTTPKIVQTGTARDIIHARTLVLASTISSVLNRVFMIEAGETDQLY